MVTIEAPAIKQINPALKELDQALADKDNASTVVTTEVPVIKEINPALKELDQALADKGQTRSPVLLLTYLRGGSTFLADILQQSPGVFYLYEPLKPFITQAYYTDDSICSIHGSCQ